MTNSDHSAIIRSNAFESYNLSYKIEAFSYYFDNSGFSQIFFKKDCPASSLGTCRQKACLKKIEGYWPDTCEWKLQKTLTDCFVESVKDYFFSQPVAW